MATDVELTVSVVARMADRILEWIVMVFSSFEVPIVAPPQS
jgi:hypothetical protein